MGKITIEFYPEDAPKTVENFLGLAKKGYYNGAIFHRVIRDFMIQGGDPTGTGRGGESIFGAVFGDELNPTTASYQAGYRKGVVAMANRGPNTNGSQFFIMLKDSSLDHLYTIFGHVVAGQEAVDSIGATQTDKDDKPVTPVVIKEVIIKDK
ncbi:MAG: peptidylprolyl isomerase [bacterium]|nr:peptidylprolyl isomerase [bacterium]